MYTPIHFCCEDRSVRHRTGRILTLCSIPDGASLPKNSFSSGDRGGTVQERSSAESWALPLSECGCFGFGRVSSFQDVQTTTRLHESQLAHLSHPPASGR